MVNGLYRKLRDFSFVAGLAAAMAFGAHADEPQSLEECFKAAQIARNNRDRESLVSLESKMSKIYFERNDYEKSLQHAANALGEIGDYLGSQSEEKGILFKERYSGLFETGALAALKLGDPEELYHFLESGRAGSLLESLGGRNAYLADLPENLRDEEKAAKEAEIVARKEFDRAIGLGEIKEIRVARQNLNDVLEKQGIASERIRNEAKKQASLIYPRAAHLKETQSHLKNNEAMIIYGLAEAESMALVIYRDKAIMASLPGEDKLREKAEGLEEKIRNLDGSSDEIISELRGLLIKPLDLEKRVQRVIISPAGQLNYIPFTVLMQDKEIVYTPSGTTYGLLLEEQAKRGTKVLAIGNPKYASSRLASLPETQHEVEAIGDVLLTKDNATKGNLFEALNKSERWRSVHFACHGLIDPNRPLFSSLALAPEKENNGSFTCLDIFRQNIPADMAVLSACETAKGKVVNGEGIVGLTRAFMYSGTPRVICSLWKVDDAATKALMVKFYELWNPKEENNSISAASALKKAQEFVRSEKKWEQPFYWAPWELWGISD